MLCRKIKICIHYDHHDHAGHHHHHHCFYLPIIVIEWPRIWPPDPPEPWKERFELIKPELRNELLLLSQIDALTSQLNSDIKGKLNSVISEYVGQSLQKTLPKGVEVSIENAESK